MQLGKQLVRKLAWIVLGGFVAGGCMVGPDYHRPEQKMPARWSSPPTTQGSVTVQRPMDVQRWWTVFHDPVLDSLIDRAVQSNLDLEAARWRVVEARASVGVARAGLFPSANASASYRRSYSGVGSSGGQDLYQAGFDAAWELDIFGGLRRSVEAANASLGAAVEDRRDVLVTLLAEVATDYIDLRGFQQEIVIAKENLEAQVRNAELARKKLQLGPGTQLDIAQADAQVASTKAQIASLESLEEQVIHALGILLGQEPTALAGELAPREKIPNAPPEVPIGVPSELLERRPDIRRAERQVAAATAEIGVATADLFPRFSLTGSFGTSARRPRPLGSWSSRAWSIGPTIDWTIFDAGRIFSNIQVQTAIQKQTLVAYRQTILVALREVEDSLVAYAREQERREALAEAVRQNQRAVQLATQRYTQGLTDFLAVLDAERSLFASQDALVQSHRAACTDLVALYKALGGGWEIERETPTSQPAR